MEKQQYWTADRIMKLIIGIIISIVLIMLLRHLKHALLPFFVACVIAYLLQPLVNLNRKLLHEKGRTFSSIFTVLEVTIVIGGFIYLVVPSIFREFDYLDTILKEVYDGERQVSPDLAYIIDFVNNHVNVGTIKAALSQMQMESLISQGSSLLTQSIAILKQMLDWILTFVYVLFILIDYPRITRGFKLLIPYKYRQDAIDIVHDMQRSMNHYFRGQGKVACCAALLYVIGFLIIRLPLAIPLGLLVGLLYMIPYFQYITLVPVALVCFICSIGGDTTFIVIFGKSILVYVVSQCICDYIITPRVMGKELGMNAAIILLSLSVWGSLLGIIGMIIALPVTSLMISYYQIYISNPRKQKKIEKEQAEEATLPDKTDTQK